MGAHASNRARRSHVNAVGDAPPTLGKRVITRAQASSRVREATFAQSIGRMPYYRVIESASTPHVEVEGRSFLNLASNNYLGLSTDPRVVEAAEQAVREWGVGVTGSRLLNGNLRLHAQLEEAICDYFEREAALVFPTGYSANLGLLSGLARPGDVVIVDEEIHASCHDGVRLSGADLEQFGHNDVDSCRRALDADAAAVCIVEGVYSMSGDVAPLGPIADACSVSSAILVVDEAHSLGVLGPTGRGLAQQTGAEASVDAIMITFSKSLGSCGGAIVGSAALIDELRYKARPLLFTASNTPSAIAGASAALEVLRAHPEYAGEVREHAARFAATLAERDIPHRYSGAAIVAVPAGPDFHTAQAWKLLWNRGIFCNASISPAVPHGAGTLRFSFMRTHSHDDVHRAGRICADVLDEVRQVMGDG